MHSTLVIELSCVVTALSPGLDFKCVIPTHGTVLQPPHVVTFEVLNWRIRSALIVPLLKRFVCGSVEKTGPKKKKKQF